MADRQRIFYYWFRFLSLNVGLIYFMGMVIHQCLLQYYFPHQNDRYLGHIILLEEDNLFSIIYVDYYRSAIHQPNLYSFILNSKDFNFLCNKESKLILLNHVIYFQNYRAIRCLS